MAGKKRIDCRNCLHCKGTIKLKQGKPNRLIKWIATAPDNLLELLLKTPVDQRGALLDRLTLQFEWGDSKITDIRCVMGQWETYKGEDKRYSTLHNFKSCLRTSNRTMHLLTQNNTCPLYDDMDLPPTV